MDLTIEQYTLLFNMVNGSITMAMNSGIPIGQEYYKDIDKIKIEIQKEIGRKINAINQ